MIQLAGLDEIPRGDPRARLRLPRGGRARLPEQRRAMWIGGGSISIPGDPLGSSASFSGAFASLFPGAYQVVQSDRGLTYGGTPAATAGNTSTTVVTLTGALATVPVPIRIECIVGGVIGDLSSEFSVSLDGGFSTSQIISLPTAGVPVALTGAASGLSVTFSAGTCSLTDSWNATCSGLADQSGNGFHYAQASAALQPIITPGLNGKPGLQFNNTRNTFLSSPCVLPAPGTTPWLICSVFTMTAISNFGRIFTDGTLMGLIANNTLASVLQYGPSGLGAAAPITLNSPVAMDTKFSNSAADYLTVGASAPLVTGPAGNAASALRMIGGNAGYANVDVYALIYVPLSVFNAAWRAVVPGFYGGTVAV